MHRLQEANLHNLNGIYDAIYRDHKDDVMYTFSAEALALYDDFDNDIVNILNSKWCRVLVNNDAEIGKDRRQVIGLAVILYVLYKYSRRAIFQSYGTVASVIGKRYVQYAIEFMSYFRKQKKAIDKVSCIYCFNLLIVLTKILGMDLGVNELPFCCHARLRYTGGRSI